MPGVRLTPARRGEVAAAAHLLDTAVVHWAGVRDDRTGTAETRALVRDCLRP